MALPFKQVVLCLLLEYHRQTDRNRSLQVEQRAGFGCKAWMTGKGTQEGKNLCCNCITDS